MNPSAVTPANSPSRASAAITVTGLTKSYGSQAAVSDVSFEVPFGSVTGFLGPNGAGKSTTLRMLVGLTAPTAGHTTVLGTPYRELADPGRRVGVLLDGAAQHAGRTGREVLTLAALLMGLPMWRVDEMIEQVGLTPREAGGAPAPTRWECASAWGSLMPCWATRACSSWTSRPTGSTPQAFTGCEACCASSPTTGVPCCCRRICCTRSRWSPTVSW